MDNTPWFVRGVASDDIIRVELDEGGVRWTAETVQASQNCTIRLIVLKDGGFAAARQSVLDVIHRLGATGEGIEQFWMVALDVPPDAELRQLRRLLEHGAAKGWWHWEEGMRHRCLEVHGRVTDTLATRSLLPGLVSQRRLESAHSSLFHMTGMAPTGSNRMPGSLLWTRAKKRRWTTAARRAWTAMASFTSSGSGSAFVQRPR
ncbi:DUF4265 domain-containing protein [Streptomyces sp. NPDC048405]|uniref:DUF4265 domain-containing protein n=1 Tax=Streptomyces sp. NPDC048405 TaxID=3365544 RepID=UPI003711A3DE